MGEWVQIIHPGTGGIGTVHQSSLPQHYACGWRLLADDEAPPPPEPAEPDPMTQAQAAQAAGNTDGNTDQE